MGGKTLTRADLAEAVVRKVGLPRNESQELVELVLSEISGSLARGEQVKLSSFGSFGIREKGERMGRNPKTGEEVFCGCLAKIDWGSAASQSSGPNTPVPHRPI